VRSLNLDDQTIRRVRAPGLHEESFAPVGCMSTPYALWPFRSRREICRLVPQRAESRVILGAFLLICTLCRAHAQTAPQFTEQTVFDAKQGGLAAISFSPDGKELLSTGENRSEKIWDIGSWDLRTSGKRPESVPFPRGPDGKPLIKSPDGKFAATFESTSIRVSSQEPGGLTRHFSLSHGNVSTIGFSADGRYLASGSSSAGNPGLFQFHDVDGRIMIWDITAGKMLEDLPAGANKPRCVAFSSDGAWLACGGNDGRIIVWKIVPPLRPVAPPAAEIAQGGSVQSRAGGGQPAPAQVADVPPPAAAPPGAVRAQVSMLWEPGKRRALWIVAVGVSRYKNPAVPPLPFAAQDANRLRDWALRADGPHLPADNVQLLLDEQATAENLKKKIDWLRRQALEEDAILFYFSGHGAPELASDGSRMDAKYLVLHETDPSDLFSTAFALDDLTRKLDQVKARTQVVVLEACYAGAVGQKVLTKNPTADLLIHMRPPPEACEKSGRVILSASSGQQVAIASEALHGGLFTHHLIEAWGNGQRRLLSEGFEDAREAVRRAATGLGSSQEPTRLGDQNLDITFKSAGGSGQ